LPEDLWRIALRAEFGVLGTALEEMREAEAALREGIARRASKREVDTLFERYNLAVEAYTEELRRNAEPSTADGGTGGPPPMGSLDEIEELLKAIEEANAAGDTEGARLALAQLAELLENMTIQTSQGGSGGGGDPSGGDMSEEEKKQLEDLADLTGKQRDLQDETERAERDDQSDEDELGPEDLARRQAELRDLLDNLGDTLAADGDGDDAAEGEDGERPGPGDQGTDPLGRRNDGGFDDGTNDADIDNRDNATRSRELMEELRRRAAEQEREAEERQYLERLLKRF